MTILEGILQGILQGLTEFLPVSSSGHLSLFQHFFGLDGESAVTMTIHPVRMSGTVLGVPQTMSYFDKMQDRIISFVSRNSNMPPERFRELMMNMGELTMDMGTVLDGEAAVSEGLIDSLGGLSDAIEALYELIETSEPRYADS